MTDPAPPEEPAVPPIQIRNVQPMTPEEVTRELAARSGLITDRAAVTIASWFRGASVGKELAALSSGVKTDKAKLLADVSASIREAVSTRPAALPAELDVDVVQLRLLYDWAEARP